MNIDNLDIVKQLIADKENGQVEFKETTGQLERGMETLCAFLNGEGGTVLFGVTDKGKIIGQEVSDKTKRDIAEAISRIEPSAFIQVFYVPVPENEKKVIALHVENARMERPFSYKGRPYIRFESATTVMPQQTYNQLLLARDGVRHRWESFPNENLHLSDMDEDEIIKTVRLGIEYGRLPESTGNDIPKILEKFGLMENGILNHAAAVLFANRELVDYPQCLLRLAKFRGTDKTEFLDNQRIKGNFFKLLDAAMAFLFKHLLLSGKIEGLEREEHLTVPYKALREGVINSLCHRQFRTSGGSVSIAIYDDRVEIENPGTLPLGWSIEKLKSEHGSDPQNPLIATVLYKRKMLESWGRGISLIMDECRKAGLPEPEFKADSSQVKLIFRYKEPLLSSAQLAGQVTGQVTGQEAGQEAGQVTEQVMLLISALSNEILSLKEIMEKLSLKGRDNFLTAYLNPALKEGFIEQTHPENPKHRNQKYRLTDKGKKLLKQ